MSASATTAEPTAPPSPDSSPAARWHRATAPELGLWTLQWAIGGFFAIVGMMMLVAPHQFNSPPYAAIRPGLPWWGTGFLVTGGAMVVVAAVAPARPFVVAAHASVGLAMLLLAGGFTVTANWFGTTVYGTLGLGTLVAPFVARSSLPPPRRRPVRGAAWRRRGPGTTLELTLPCKGARVEAEPLARAGGHASAVPDP